MPTSTRDGHSDAVTAVVGTVLVLAVTTTGIAVALFLGAPVIQRLQDEAAVDSVVGHFEAARQVSAALSVPNASRSTPLSLPSGLAALSPGSHFLVSMATVAACAPSITDWADWGQPANITLTVSGCAALSSYSGPCANTQTCIRAYDMGNGQVVSTAYAPGTLTIANLRRDRDYNITVTNATGVELAHAWLIHTDRLEWSRASVAGGVSAALEAGALFASEHGTIYRVSGPRLDEGGGTSLALSLPVFHNSTVGGAVTEGERRVFQRLDERTVLNTTLGALWVRFEVHGDLAEAWCNAVLQRNGDPAPASYGAVPGRAACAPDAMGVRGVQYARSDGAPFPFQFGYAVLHARLFA